MKTVLKTPPVKYPVSLIAAKNHLNVDLDWTVDDDYIETLIEAATQKAEQFLHRRLITQTWYYYLASWPSCRKIILPFGKLQSVTSIKYKDTDGDESTWSTDEYIVDTNTDPGEVVLGYEKSYPQDTLYPSNPITIEFVCGYGADRSTVPANIKHAIKLIISDFYENRETEYFGLNHIKLKTVELLLFTNKLFGGIPG